MDERTRRISTGFTLIELLITIVILAIIVTLAAPSFVDVLDRRRIVDAAETVVKQVQQARAVAIETNRQISMVFDDGAEPWCFGLTDRATCTCTVTDLADAEACTIPLGAAQASLAGIDRVLVQATSMQFRGLADVTFPANALRFEPLRGIRVDDGRFDPSTFVEFESLRGRTVRVVVNRLGRAGTCTPNASVPTMRVCPPED